MPVDEKRILDDLRKLHAVVDRQAHEIGLRLNDRLHCRPGCVACCQDDLTVFEVEAARIRAEFPEMLSDAAPGPLGACAFLDDAGHCRIYAARPYVCRSHGLPLRWLVEREDGWVEVRNICPENEVDLDVEALEADECFTLGPTEEVLRELETAFSGGPLTRVGLRELFAKRSG